MRYIVRSNAFRSATGTLCLTLAALKQLGLRQRAGGWTHVDQVSIASSDFGSSRDGSDGALFMSES